MKKLLLSAAALTLLAFPALAQQPNGFDLTHGAAQAQRPAQAERPAQAQRPARAERPAQAQRAAPAPQPQAAPQQRGGGDRGANRGGGDRGGNRGGSTNGFDLTHGMPQATQQNRGASRDNNRGNDNRGGFNGRRGDNRGGYDNRGNRGYGNGPRRDYSSFRNYHRGTNASRRFRAPAYRRPSGWYDRRWTFGEFLPSLFWSSNYWLNDYNTYDLPPPPYGAVWVRNGNDALLIDRDSGEIISIEYGVFY